MDQFQYDRIYEIRRQYGGTFITAFDDGIIVPWKLLSIKDYMQFAEDRDKGIIPLSRLENEIFIKCVLDSVFIKQIDLLKAGIIHTVVTNIWEYSGPASAQDFSSDLNTSRELFYNSKFFVIHELVNIITMAFPYKPEEVYEMSYDVFLMRLIQAEKKLIALGIYLKEPISIQFEDSIPQKTNKQQQQQKIDAKRIWEELQYKKETQPITNKEDIASKKKWWKISPVLEAPNKHNIDFKLESQEQYMTNTGHEKLDLPRNRKQLVEDARVIYKDLLETLAKKKKQ